ncbi:MAG: hypothetical protein ACHQET_11270 [Chitinophagales bacterium]
MEGKREGLGKDFLRTAGSKKSRISSGLYYFLPSKKESYFFFLEAFFFEAFFLGELFFLADFFAVAIFFEFNWLVN